MILAMISRLDFKQDDYRHTVKCAQECQKLTFNEMDRMSKAHTFKAVIA